MLLFWTLSHWVPPRSDCFAAWQLRRKTRFRYFISKFTCPKPSNNYPRRLWTERWVYMWSWLYLNITALICSIWLHLKFHNITGFICSMNIVQSNQWWYFPFEISYLCFITQFMTEGTRECHWGFHLSRLMIHQAILIMHMPMQVLDFAAFSEPEYDLPIFCANAFTTPAQSIVVL